MFSLATNTPSYLLAVGYGLQFSIGLLEFPRVGYGEGTGGQYCSRQSWQRHSSPCGTSCSLSARNYFVGSGITGPRVWTISGWNEIALPGPLRAKWCGGPVGGHLFLFSSYALWALSPVLHIELFILFYVFQISFKAVAFAKHNSTASLVKPTDLLRKSFKHIFLFFRF